MIYHLTAIDPGTRNVGYARGTHGRILDAGCSKASALPLSDLAVHHTQRIGKGTSWAVVLESMVYAPTRATTPQDLLDVQTVGCLTARAVGAEVILRTPGEWKGQVPKSVHVPRFLRALTPDESRIVEAAAKAAKANAKEVYDAVGLYLFQCGRISKTGEAV